MKTEIENMDDIVFDERNQNYGAYFLRRTYNKNVSRALFFAVFLFSGIISIPLIAGLMHSEKKLANDGIVEMDSTLVTPPDEKTLPDLPEPIKQERIQAFTPPIVVTDTTEITIDFGDILEGAGNGKINEKEGGELLVEDPKDHIVIETGTIEKLPTIVELMPAFKGGEEALYMWLSENIKYPQVAKETGIQGTVVVTFVVEKDGSITGAQLLKDIGGGCGDEAIRVVKKMPKWREGRQNNTPVRVQFNLPVKFTLE
jgi:periplasmic protein TonB